MTCHCFDIYIYIYVYSWCYCIHYDYCNVRCLVLQWRHNKRDGVPNRRLFKRRSKKTSKLRVTGLCAGNSSVTGEFPHKGHVTRKMFPFDDVILGNKHTVCKYKTDKRKWHQGDSFGTKWRQWSLSSTTRWYEDVNITPWYVIAKETMAYKNKIQLA